MSADETAPAGSPIHSIAVMFLENVQTEEGVKVRMVQRTVPFKAIFGDADVAQVNSFWIRLHWQPEAPIEYKPSPYYLG